MGEVENTNVLQERTSVQNQPTPSKLDSKKVSAKKSVVNKLESVVEETKENITITEEVKVELVQEENKPKTRKSTQKVAQVSADAPSSRTRSKSSSNIRALGTSLIQKKQQKKAAKK